MPINSPSLSEIPAEFTSKTGDSVPFYTYAKGFSNTTSYGVTRQYLHLHQTLAESEQKLDKDQLNILLLASITHGRVGAVLDKLEDQSSKTFEKDRADQRHLRFSRELAKHLSNDDLAEIVETAFNKNSKLSEIFALIHRIGSFRTGINSWIKANNSNSITEDILSPEFEETPVQVRPGQAQLEKLVFDVFAEQLSFLIEKSAHEPAVKKYLNSQQTIITEITEKMPFSVLSSLENQTSKAKQFTHAAYLWRQFLTPTTAGQKPWQEVAFNKDNSKDIAAQ